MPKKSKWYTSMWKVIGVLSVIFGLIASALQIFRAIDFWGLLILPLYDFLTSSVSIFYAVLFVAVVLILSYIVVRVRGRSNILDFRYGRCYGFVTRLVTKRNIIGSQSLFLSY